MKKHIWIPVILLLLALGFFYVFKTSNGSLSPKGNTSESIVSGDTVSSENQTSDKGIETASGKPLGNTGTACTMEYAPVCASVEVVCVKAPCNPVEKTFSNKCVMKSNSSATFLHDGECLAK